LKGSGGANGGAGLPRPLADPADAEGLWSRLVFPLDQAGHDDGSFQRVGPRLPDQGRAAARIAPQLGGWCVGAGPPGGPAGARFTTGCVPCWTLCPHCQGTMTIVVPSLSLLALPFSGAGSISAYGAGVMRGGCAARADRPLSANQFGRPPAQDLTGSAPERCAAHRSSGVHGQAHADRRHPRGRDPRGGAGR